MQDAKRLAGARVDRRPGAHKIVANLEEFDPEMGHRGVDVNLGQPLDGDGLLPDYGHGDARRRLVRILGASQAALLQPSGL